MHTAGQCVETLSGQILEDVHDLRNGHLAGCFAHPVPVVNAAYEPGRWRHPVKLAGQWRYAVLVRRSAMTLPVWVAVPSNDRRLAWVG